MGRAVFFPSGSTVTTCATTRSSSSFRRCSTEPVAGVTQESAPPTSKFTAVNDPVRPGELRRRVGERMNGLVGLAHFAGIVVALISAGLTNAHIHSVGFETTDVVVLAGYIPLTMVGC